MNGEDFRDGLFALQTARFGRVPELLIARLAGLKPARAIFHDLYDDLEDHRVEVKFSRVLRAHEAPISPATLLDAIADARASQRMVAYADRTSVTTTAFASPTEW